MGNKVAKNDGISDLLTGLKSKRNTQARIGEIFISRESGLLSWKRGVNDIVSLQSVSNEGGETFVDFLAFAGEAAFILKKRNEQINGKDAWSELIGGDTEYLVSWNGDDNRWEIYVAGNLSAYIDSDPTSTYPDAGYWSASLQEVTPELSFMQVIPIQGTLQDALETLAIYSASAFSARNINFYDEEDQIGETTVQGAIENIYKLAESGGYTKTVITLSSSDILNLGSSITALMPPSFGRYYKGSLTVEYHAGSTPYTFGKNIIIAANGVTIGVLGGSFISGTNKFKTFNLEATSGDCTPSQAVTITTDDGSSPTSGDGTFIIKITYKREAFGL